MPMACKATQDLQCPHLELSSCCSLFILIHGTNFILAPHSSLGTPGTLPPQDLCTCCFFSQKFYSPIGSFPSLTYVTILVVPPIYIRFKMVPSYPQPHLISSDILHILLILLLAYLLLYWNEIFMRAESFLHCMTAISLASKTGLGLQ